MLNGGWGRKRMSRRDFISSEGKECILIEIPRHIGFNVVK